MQTKVVNCGWKYQGCYRHLWCCLFITGLPCEIEFQNAISAPTDDCSSVQICWGMLQVLQEIENIRNIVNDTTHKSTYKHVLVWSIFFLLKSSYHLETRPSILCWYYPNPCFTKGSLKIQSCGLSTGRLNYCCQLFKAERGGAAKVLTSGHQIMINSLKSSHSKLFRKCDS